MHSTLKPVLAGIAIVFTTICFAKMDKSKNAEAPLRSQILYTKKLKTPADIKLTLINEEEEVEAGREYTVEAVIQSPKNFTNVVWEWEAPKSVQLLDRSYGQGLAIKADEELKLKMRFRQNNNENHRVRLVLKDAITGNLIGRGRFHTTKQRIIAQENKELLERQEQYLENNTEVLDKVREPKHSH